MKNKIISLAIIVLLIMSIVPSYQSATKNISGEFKNQYQTEEEFSSYSELSFGSELNLTGDNQTVDMSNPNPSNGETDVSISQSIWNITFTDFESDTFNWSIEVNNTDTNSSNDDTDGNRYVELTTPLSYSTTYTVWVNATDSGSLEWNNQTFTFTTEDEYQFTLYNELSFGSKLDVEAEKPIIESIYPTNGSTEVEMYPLLNATIDEPQNDNFNITWKTNATGIWSILQFNDTCTDGSYTHRAVFANESNTQYWWRIEVNDSEGNWANETYNFTTDEYDWTDWSEWWEFNYSIDSPTSLSAIAYNQTVINLTWLTDGGIDTAVLIVNESGWADFPNSVTNGTELYNGTNLFYNHTELSPSTTYYYSIWGYNLTDNEYSIAYDYDSATTEGEASFGGPYPANESTEISRPPVNISVGVTGTNMDIYFYFWNRTPHIETWSLLASWSGVDSDRYEVFDLDTLNGTNEFIWGGTTYNWSVKVNTGGVWSNVTYWYNTTGSRYDIDKNDNVFVGDLSETWANRGGSFDGYYDTDDNGNIFVGDLSEIWANR